MPNAPDPLERAKNALDKRFDELARTLAGRPQPDVLDALERAVRRAGVTPRRPDLTALSRRISRARPDGS